MNREEAIRAMLDGKVITIKGAEDEKAWWSKDLQRFMWQFLDNESETFDHMYSFTEFEIVKEPTTRPMTREEVLGFLANNTDVVVRYDGGEWHLKEYYARTIFDVDRFQYAHISEDGVIGEAKKFEITE